MTDEEKYQALICYIISGENPRLFEFDMEDFVSEMYSVYAEYKNRYNNDNVEY